MNQSNVQRRILAKAKPKRQSDETSDQSKRESRTKSDRHAVESRNQVSTMNQKSEKLKEVKLRMQERLQTQRSQMLQAKNAMAKTLDESREPVTQNQMQS